MTPRKVRRVKAWKGHAILNKESGDIVRIPTSVFAAFLLKGVLNKETHEIIEVKITQIPKPKRGRHAK